MNVRNMQHPEEQLDAVDDAIESMQHWLEGTPVDEQEMIHAVAILVSVAKIFLVGEREKNKDAL